ncbi:MAG: hypothetical protein JSS75_14715 [Bacteroidetes bacterium]|nr:hypothetical protein [Bacteroidota bacterium]
MPIWIDYHYEVNGATTTSYDTTKLFEFGYGLGPASQMTGYRSTGDTVDLWFASSGSPFYSDDDHVHIVVDPGAAIVETLTIDYHVDYDYRDEQHHTTCHIHARPFPYVTDSLGSPHALMTNTQCYAEFDTMQFTVFNQKPLSDTSYSLETFHFVKMAPDTVPSRFVFSISVDSSSLLTPSSPAIDRSALKIFYVLESGEISINIPRLNHPETLVVSDVLGRIMKSEQISITPQALSLKRSVLPPGLYFARLGELTTSFVVP